MIITSFFDPSIIITVLLMIVLVVSISLNLYLRKKKPSTQRKAISKAYIEVLKEALGQDNLTAVKIEHERVKFIINDIKKCDLKILKGFSKEGVFVKGKEITMAFNENPNDIKKYLESEI